MSAAVADAASAPPKKSKKKLFLIVGIVALLLAVAGGGALLMMKKQAAAAAEDGEEAAPVETAHARHDPKELPVFMPLDPFTVNLADRDAERYLQVGVTFEVDDAHTIDTLKAYMPAIRNNILLVLAHKTSDELLQREGKDKLAREIRREAVRPLGIEIDDEDEEDDAHADEAKAKPKKKKKRRAAPVLPVKQVHFSNFIIQ